MTNNNLFPAVNPTVMEGVEMPLPPEIERIAEAFKADQLKDVQHEVVSPGTPNSRKVGQKIAEMSYKSRQELKKKGVLQITGRKLYVCGGAVRDWVINHFHGIVHPQDDWDLATDASPEALRLIIKVAVEHNLLPHDTSLSMTDKTFGNIILTVNGKRYEVTTFPFAGSPDAPRMYLDSLRRDFSPNALYYSVDEKKIYDYHSGITDIYRKNPNFIGKARKRLKDDDGGLRPLVYARLHSRMSAKDVDQKTREEMQNFRLPLNVDRHAVHDEFARGIKQTLDKSKYIKLLNDLGLLRQIFPTLRVDPDAPLGEMTLLPQIVAQVLRANWNNLSHVMSTLNALDFDKREVHDIIFLLKLPYYQDEHSFRSEKTHTSLSDRAIDQFVKTTKPRNAEWIRAVIKR